MNFLKKILGSESAIGKSKGSNQNHSQIRAGMTKVIIPENLQELVQTHSEVNLTFVLPKEVLSIIFSFLDAPSLISVSKSCKLFYSLCQSISVWKSISLSKRDIREEDLACPVGKDFNWKAYYRIKHLISQPNFMGWNWIPPSSGYPSKRHCHTGVLWGDETIIYIGGQKAHGSRFDDVHHFNVKTKEFTRENVLNVPNFSKHSSVEINGLIYVFGGFDGFQTKYELAIYNPTTLEWNVPKDVKGDVPPSRSNHRVGVIGTRMYMFGGIRGGPDGNLDDLNDFYVLETTTLTWRKIKGNGTVPPPRSGHLLAAVGKKLYLFGGGSGTGSSHKWDTRHSDIYVFDSETERWTQLKFASPKKNGVCIYSAYFNIGPFLFVFGGEQLDTLNHRKELSKDLYVLDTVLLEWEKIEAAGSTSSNTAILGTSSPKSRDTAVFTLTKHAAYLSHGYNSEPLSDFWELKFKKPLMFDE